MEKGVCRVAGKHLFRVGQRFIFKKGDSNDSCYIAIDFDLDCIGCVHLLWLVVDGLMVCDVRLDEAFFTVEARLWRFPPPAG